MVGFADRARQPWRLPTAAAQQETTVLGVPCVTMRERNRVPSQRSATGRIALPRGRQPFTRMVADTEAAAASGRRAIGAVVAPSGWDGRSAFRYADALSQF